MLSTEIKQYLMQAIDQIESACAEARIEVEDLITHTPTGRTNSNMYAIEKVLHIFSWAQANAFECVRSAMSQYERDIIFQKLEEDKK